MDSKTNLKWNPFYPGYFNNPYESIKEWRNNNPVQKILGDSYIFFNYEDINSILKEKEFKVHSLSEYLEEKEDYIFKNTVNACPYLSKSTQLWPMYLNNNLHRKIRTSITKAFHSLPFETIIVEALEETNLEFLNKADFNLVDYCGQFIYKYIKNTLNIDDKQEYKTLKHFSNLLAKSQDLYTPKQVYQEINENIIALKDVFKNSTFKNTLIEETKDMNIDEDQLYSMMLISFMAAFETSKDNLSLGLIEVLKDPKLIDFTTNCTSKELKVFIEEILRYTSPLQYTIRINTRPLHINGIDIPTNSKLYLCIASANRDENVFDTPDKLIPNRKLNAHLSFGAGTHICLGSTIARKEMEICLKKMIEFLKDYSIEDIKWNKQIFMRTANTINLKLKK